MSDGDSIRLASPGGGGFGNPLERELAMVERDLNRGYIGRGTAENSYGVVVAQAVESVGGHTCYRLDEQASMARRQQLMNTGD